MLVATRTGLRLGELRGLQWGDADLDRRTLRVARAFTKDCSDEPKSGTLDLSWDDASLGRVIGPHELRHTAASHHAMRCTPLPVIQQWLGHADIATTMRYAHLCPSTTARFADNVAPHRGPQLVPASAGHKAGYKEGDVSKNAV